MRIPNLIGQLGQRFLAILICLTFTSTLVTSQESGDYKDYKKLTSELMKLEKVNNKITNLESIGKTAEGRDIWLFSLGNKAGADISKRPAILVTANLEADHLVGSEIALGVIGQLISGYGKDAEVTNAIDNYVIYVMPRVNPDGAEAFFAQTKTGQKTNNTPYDGDNDGRMDEDGPEDLNGDGVISLMRVKDLVGLYCSDPDNEDLLKVADPTKGETGVFSVFWEGIDNDGDGFINEDPKGGVDINRNFAHEYPYFKPDAGIHMVSEKETRAFMDWIIAHRNVAIMVTLGESDNLLTPPNSRGQLSSNRPLSMFEFADASIAEAEKVGMVRTGGSFGRFGGMRFFSRGGGSDTEQSGRSARPARKAATTYNPADLVYYSKVSEKYKELTGIKTAPVLREPKGALSEYGYFQYGILSLGTPGWGFPEKKDTSAQAEGRRGSGRNMARNAPQASEMRGSSPGGGARTTGIDAEYYQYLSDNQPEGFVKWESFNHPDLGEVEIGGFAPYQASNPASDMLPMLAESHADFVLYLSTLFGEVKIAKTEVVNHNDGLFTVKAVVQNKGFLPTALQHGVVARAVSPTMVQLEIDPERIISGNSKTNFIQQLDGSGKTESYEWLITGKKGDEIAIKLVSQKAGADATKIKLQ